MPDEHCPRCESVRDSRPKLPPRQYVCGTFWVSPPDNNIIQTDRCRIRELTRQRDRLIDVARRARSELSIYRRSADLCDELTEAIELARDA